jgi:hypothetical protein
VVLVVVDETPGATKESSAAAAAKHKLDGLPVLTDEKNATGKALGAEVDNSISYVVIKPDGTKKVLSTPNAVKKFIKN